MLEAYQAYGDYHQMADITQELIQKAALAVRGTTTVTGRMEPSMTWVVSGID